VKLLSHPRHNCVIDQLANENKVIHTLIIDFFSHGLRSVKIEQELEKQQYDTRIVPKSNWKIEETETKSISLTQIFMTTHFSGLGTCTSIIKWRG